MEEGEASVRHEGTPYNICKLRAWREPELYLNPNKKKSSTMILLAIILQ
jgi:hypothetical protein